MPEQPEALRVAAGWVEKADNDLKNASHTLELDEDCPTDTVVFHAQQCVEKYLKALLVVDGIDFPRTHSVSVLLDLLAESIRPALTTEEQERLTDYATTTRYPGDYEDISLEEAHRATAIAARVRGVAREKLPQQALRIEAPEDRHQARDPDPASTPPDSGETPPAPDPAGKPPPA